MAFVTPVVEHWLEREIAQWVHPMKDRSDDPSHHLPKDLLYTLLLDMTACSTIFDIPVVGHWLTWGGGGISRMVTTEVV